MPREEREARRKRAQVEARRAGNRRAAPVRDRADVHDQIVEAAEAAAEEPETKSRPSGPVIPPQPVGERMAGSKTAPRKVPTRAVPVKAPPPARRAAERRPAARVLATAEATHNSDLDAAISHMELEFIQCRDFGHSWRPYSARWLPSDNCYESQLRCARCKAIRTRWLSRTGSQVGGGYDYADGYLVKGIGRLTGTDRDKIRLASVLAVLPSDTASEED